MFGESIIEEVNKCLQCAKCSSGCLLVPEMDYLPNQINRMVQLGYKDRLLNSSSIWLCVGCQTCVSRCPMEVDMPKIFDSLRIMAIEEGVVSEPKIALFHRLFLESIKRWGRVFEAELIGLYKLKTGTLFSDAKAGQKMFIKGKISLLPKPIKSRSSVKEMFRR